MPPAGAAQDGAIVVRQYADGLEPTMSRQLPVRADIVGPVAHAAYTAKDQALVTDVDNDVLVFQASDLATRSRLTRPRLG